MIIIVITVIILIILSLFCIFWGYQLRRGRWLKSIAGNNFGELPEDTAKELGKKGGFSLYIVGFLIGLFSVTFIFDMTVILYSIIAISVIISLITIPWAIKKWIERGY